jgi:hypothetical protein
VAAYEVLLLNTAVPQIQAAQSGDTYVVPRDIAFSAALTLSAGTANGVAYLNASKVLTTGSALTFDGTNLGVGSEVGVSPSNGLTRSWGNTKRFAWMSFDSSYYMEINADAANRVINYTVNSGDNTATHIWNLGASGTPTEQMRLTSTGLGIGTSSPSYNLEVAGAVRSTVAIRGNFAGGTDIGHLRYLNANGSIVADMFAQTTNGGASDSAYLAWQTVNSGSLAERMRLDSSGNLGIGTSSPGAKLDVFAGTTNSAVAQLTGNNTGRGLKVSTAQTTFADDTVVLDAQMATYGVLQLATGGTTRATLDSSGNLGLGVTPKTWSVGPAIEVGNYFLKLAGSGTYGAVVLNNAYYNGGWKFAEANWANMYQTVGGVHSWHTSTIAGAAANDPISFVQAMTLDASGNLVVGNTSAWARFHATKTVDNGPGSATNVTDYNGSAFVLHNQDDFSGNKAAMIFAFAGAPGVCSVIDGYKEAGSWNTGLRFYTNATTGGNVGQITERARITSGGTLAINVSGVTYSSEKLAVLAATNSLAAAFKTDAGTTEYTIAVSNTATSGDNKFVVFATESTDTTRGSITYDRAGGLVAYNTTSDYRAKDIFGPVANAGAIIDALKVYTGKMKGATLDRPMLIAHETQEVTPYAVTGEKDAVDENGDPVFQQMNLSAFVPLLIAEIQSLRARVAQLEGA